MSFGAAMDSWVAGTWNYPNQSLTAQEYMFGGIADYGQPYPCPNGLGVVDTKPSESAAWRIRIEKARIDIAAWSAEIRVRGLAAEITVDEIHNDIEEIRAWAKSLKSNRQ